MAVTITQTANPAGVSAVSTNATYSGISIGTADASRIVVVCVGVEETDSTIFSCKIDGNTMSASNQGTFGIMFARIFYLAYPTGTTANIVVGWQFNSPSNIENHIAVYSVTGGNYEADGSDSSSDMDASDPLTTDAITIASGGGFIGIAACAVDTVAKTWENATEDIDDDTGDFRFTTATRTTALTTTAVTCTGTNNGEDGGLAWIKFTAIPVSGPANLKTYNTNLKANIKTINTNPIANVKTLNTNV